MDKELKTLKVFSKKLDTIIDVFNNDNTLKPAIENAWMNNGWSNAYGLGWANNGWSNARDSWLDNGWNNARGLSWMDNGWNNYRGESWTDHGWNNYRGVWTNSYDNGYNNNNTGNEGCFITTAVVEHMGLDDNCDELSILRQYRDKLAQENPEFRKIVLEYYKTAPQIVAKISNSENKDEILDNIYKELVVPVTKLLKDGQVEEAKEHYINMYNALKKKYV